MAGLMEDWLKVIWNRGPGAYVKRLSSNGAFSGHVSEQLKNKDHLRKEDKSRLLSKPLLLAPSSKIKKVLASKLAE